MQKHDFRAPFASPEAEVLFTDSATYESPSCEIILTAPAFSFLSGGDNKRGGAQAEDWETDSEIIK